MEQSKFYQIKNITEHEYTLVGCDGSVITRPIQDVDKSASAFTIQDAKDGDVLACESGWTCIFKALDNHANTFSSYCFMDKDKWFCNTGSECHTLDKAFIKAYNGEIYPATKQQRDQLEKAMADAGYTFDFEKKELKKIEQTPAWSEEDEQYLLVCKNALAKYQVSDKWDAHIISHWLENKLKSPRPQNTWKPSTIQMNALESAIEVLDADEDGLTSLFEQLKKLKG